MKKQLMPPILIGLALSCFCGTVFSDEEEQELHMRPNPEERGMQQSSQRDLNSKARKADPAGPVSRGGTEKMGIVMEEQPGPSNKAKRAGNEMGQKGIIIENTPSPELKR